jgi:hypothetical protein
VSGAAFYFFGRLGGSGRFCSGVGASIEIAILHIRSCSDAYFQLALLYLILEKGGAEDELLRTLSKVIA